jgi:hypothetical protein
MSSLTGFEPSLPAPLMEKYFEHHSPEERTDLDSRDGHWSPYPMQRPEQRAMLANCLSTLSSLCQIYHEVVLWNRRRVEDDGVPLGSREDVNFRLKMLGRLTDWDAQLPDGLKPGDRNMAHTYYLR